MLCSVFCKCCCADGAITVSSGGRAPVKLAIDLSICLWIPVTGLNVRFKRLNVTLMWSFPQRWTGLWVCSLNFDMYDFFFLNKCVLIALWSVMVTNSLYPLRSIVAALWAQATFFCLSPTKSWRAATKPDLTSIDISFFRIKTQALSCYCKLN